MWKTPLDNTSAEVTKLQFAESTKDCVQVCSILHFAHVYVRHVIHVIVHNGLTDVEGVLVVKHTFT